MRQSIILLIVLLVAVVLYTAYGLMAFEPDPASPFTFSEPVIPPEILAANAAQAAEGAPTGNAQTDAAMTQMTQAITLYQSYERDASPQAVSTFSILNAAVFNGRLPAYLLSQSKNVSQVRDFELITLDPRKVTAMRSGQTTLTCGLGASAVDIMVGDNGDNRIICEINDPSIKTDRIFLGGPGNDELISAQGNRIINAGTGDDKITAGPGRTIIMLDDAWGKDTLTVDCTNAKVTAPAELPPNFPIPWVQPYTNFILLSPRINPSDVEWNGLVLTNKTTGDTLSVNENCFNLISAGQASSQ